MKISLRGLWILTTAALLALASGNVAAKGGFVELPGDFDDSSNVIDNPWWPQNPGEVLIYIEEADDECVIGVLEIVTGFDQYMPMVNGVKVREVWDREFIHEVEDEEETVCDGDLEDILGSLDDFDLLESTLDWYAQDIDGNVWYFGEHTVATDHDECDHGTVDALGEPGVDPVLELEGCLDGSWLAGYDIWEDEADENILPGIIMLTNPVKGQFYFQEFWEDEATDMGKVLNFKTIDTFTEGEMDGCVMIKEWVPLEPGNVEHKYYCYGYGLLLVEGNAGGKTVYTDLVEVIEP